MFGFRCSGSDNPPSLIKNLRRKLSNEIPDGGYAEGQWQRMYMNGLEDLVRSLETQLKDAEDNPNGASERPMRDAYALEAGKWVVNELDTLRHVVAARDSHIEKLNTELSMAEEDRDRWKLRADEADRGHAAVICTNGEQFAELERARLHVRELEHELVEQERLTAVQRRNAERYYDEWVRTSDLNRGQALRIEELETEVVVARGDAEHLWQQSYDNWVKAHTAERDNSDLREKVDSWITQYQQSEGELSELQLDNRQLRDDKERLEKNVAQLIAQEPYSGQIGGVPEVIFFKDNVRRDRPEYEPLMQWRFSIWDGCTMLGQSTSFGYRTREDAINAVAYLLRRKWTAVWQD